MGAGVLAAAFVLLWVVVFLSRRRFGVLGLALASGALLSSLWLGQLVQVVGESNIELASMSTAGAVSIALVLAPAVLLFFSGPSYRSKKGRALGATLFAVLAIVLLAEPISSILVLDSASRSVFDELVRHQGQVVTVGLVLALLDVLATHTNGSRHPKTKKH